MMHLSSRLLFLQIVFLACIVSVLCAPSFALPNLTLKIGIVDDTALLRAPTLQALVQSSQKKSAAYQKELAELYKVLQKAQAEFAKNEAIMDQGMQASQKKVVDKLSKRCRTILLALEAETSALQDKITLYLRDACVKVSKQSKYNMLLSTNGNVLYADPALDVTTQVSKALPKTDFTASETAEATHPAGQIGEGT
jgi:Skp family chaperone for outer membrane proteins